MILAGENKCTRKKPLLVSFCLISNLSEKKQKAILFFLSNSRLEVCLRSEDPATGHLSASSFVFIHIQANVETVPNLQVVRHASTESYSLLSSSKESVFHFPVTFPIHRIFFYCSFLPLSLSLALSLSLSLTLK